MKRLHLHKFSQRLLVWPDQRVSQRRESVSVAIKRQRPGVAALNVRWLHTTHDNSAYHLERINGKP